jgi:hypothetical protein
MIGQWCFQGFKMTVWLIAFYCFVALCGGFFWFLLSLNRPLFRNDEGDLTTEAGYEEDSVGRRSKESEESLNDSDSEPHVIAEPGSANSVI